MALILVVLVLTSLVAIGTPFIISMKLQERGSVQTVAKQRAHLAALSARNHALAHLFGTHDSREREQLDDDGIPGHKFDTFEELQVPFDPELAFNEDRISDFVERKMREREANGEEEEKPLGYAMRGDRGGRTIDAVIEDEQGKINLNTAMPNLIGNLLGGSHLSESIKFDQALTDLPLDDTSTFPADDDPDTVDGVVVILNPIFFTVEALSYRGKTETHLTGCFRGEYVSGTWEHQKGWPVFDLRGLKVFLHRYYDLEAGIDTFRTPQAIREISDWSVVPYFLETIAVLGLDINNMKEWGLSPEMLLRADIAGVMKKFDKDETPYDESEYRETRRELLELGIPREAMDLVEQFRGKAGLISIGKIAKRANVDKVRANAFKGFFETTIKKELKRLKKHSQGYFPKAFAAFDEIDDVPGMETFTAQDFERIRPYITTNSTLDALWSPEQMVIGQMSTDSLLGVPSFRLPRYDHFNPGTLVRIRSITDPNKIEFHLAAGAFPSPGGRGGQGRGTIIQGGVILKNPLKYEYEEREALVSAQLRHPININTAPARVVAAVLTGISTDRFSQQFDSVTATEARALTTYLFDKMPIRGFGEFKEHVEAAQGEGIITDEDVAAILLNAVNPNHPRLTISTTGFCYASKDVYTVEASGVVRNPSGVEVGLERFREVIEVAPPDPLEFVIDSQDEWTGLVFRRDAPRNAQWATATTFFPGRGQHLMTTAPIPLNQRRFEAPSLVEGALQALTTESPSVGSVTASVEHFPESIEGLEEGTHSIDISGLDEPGSPLSLDLWVKPRSLTGIQTIFDSLLDPAQPFENRIRLFWQGDTRELVFQIYDDARLTNFGRREVLPCAEVRHALGAGWQPDTWYHVSVAWGSALPGDQTMLVDTRHVGDHTFLTTLSGGMTEDQEGFLNVRDIDFANQLPADRGALWVGGEVIDYIRREGTRFQIGALDPAGVAVSGRARRGTSRRAHAAGTTVRPFGYSVELVASDPEIPARVTAWGTTLNPQARIPVAVTGTGGAALATAVATPKGTIGAIGSLGGVIGFGAGEPFEASYPLIRWDQGGTEQVFLIPLIPNQSQLTVVSETPPDQLGFPEQGYLCVRYWIRPNGADRYTGQSEMIRYTGFGPGSQPSTFVFTGLARARLGSEQIDSGLLSGIGDRICEVFSVSVEANVTDLSRRFPPSGVAQITPVRGEVEWFYYKWIEEDRFFVGDPRVLAVEDRGPGTISRGFRGYLGSLRDVQTFEGVLPLFWPQNTPIVPVLRAVRAGPEAWDRVLISESANTGGPGASEPTPILVRKSVDGDDGVFIGLERAPLGSYPAAQLPRLKMYPTGEIPTRNSGTILVGDSVVGGSTFDGVIDEVRLSQIRPPGLWGVVLANADGAPSFDARTEGGFTYLDLIREYPRGDALGAGDPLDRIRMIPIPRLVSDDESDDNSFESPLPGQFAADRSNLLLAIGSETFYGERETLETGEQLIFLMQNLRKTEAADPETGFVPDSRRLMRDTIIVNDTSNIPPRHGFLAIESDAGIEIIYYESTGPTTLRNVKRGLFGTIISEYQPVFFDNNTSTQPMRVVRTYDFDLMKRSLLDSEETQGSLESVVPLSFLGAGRLTGEIEYAVPLNRVEGFQATDGYLRLDDGNRDTADEIIGYVRREGSSFLLGRDDRTGRPLFRRRFGTPENNATEVVVTEFLTRYHDRYEPEAESGDLLKWDRSISIPGAHWDRVRWEIDEDRSGAGRAEVLVHARLDGIPSWDQAPTAQRGGVFLFRDPDGDNQLNRTADQIELRIQYRFREGSYGPARSGSIWNDEWKRTPTVERLILDYRKDWRVVHREDLPF